MELNRPRIQYSSPEWAKIEEWLGQELYDTYKQLASLSASWEKTLVLRGRASLLEQMLDFRNLKAVGEKETA